MKPTEVKAQIDTIKNKLAHIISRPVSFTLNTIALGTVEIVDITKAKVSDLRFAPDKVYGTVGKNTQVMSIIFTGGEVIDIPVCDISQVEVTVQGARIIVGETVLDFAL